MEEEIAGQSLEDIAIGGHEQAAADGGKGIKLLKAAPDPGFALLRGHLLGDEVADHA